MGDVRVNVLLIILYERWGCIYLKDYGLMFKNDIKVNSYAIQATMRTFRALL